MMDAPGTASFPFAKCMIEIDLTEMTLDILIFKINESVYSLNKQIVQINKYAEKKSMLCDRNGAIYLFFVFFFLFFFN